MLPRLFTSLFSGMRPKVQAVKEIAATLPDDMLQTLGGKKAVALKAAVRQAFQEPNDGQAFVQLLLGKARDLDWDDDEIEKIVIYADYFSGQTGGAYQRIVAKGFEQTDPEMFVLACMALYMNDEFERSYALLRTRNIGDPAFLANPDFMGFAGYIALSAGAGVEKSLAYFDPPLETGTITNAYVTNAYPVYFEAGRLQTVADLHHYIQRNFSDDPQAVYALACVELARGYFPEGFRLAECRYQHPDATQFINGDLFDKPRWQGESLVGKRLLVHAEQGLGDLLMCARYLPGLTEMAAGVSVESHEVAIPLLAPNFPKVNLLPIHRKLAASSEFDYWVGAMSLPHLFNSTVDSVPGKNGYLSCPTEHLQHWNDSLLQSGVGNKLRIGIAWSGNPRHRADRRRSMKFDVVRPYIARMPDVEFFSLQTDVPVNYPDNLTNYSEEMVTLADTAALIMEMDLVITVDTSVVHIAGALGKETWLLLPYRYEWRWGLEGEANPWYESVRVIRQPYFEDWVAVLEDVFSYRLPEYLEKLGRGVA